jgi:hypothetical protein
LRSFHPVSSARLASALHPIGTAFLVVFGAPGIIAFALLHGAGNGMITIAKGTLPLALFGPRGYGLRSGLLSAPARMLQAASPFLFGLLLDRAGIGAVGLSAAATLLCPTDAAALMPSGRTQPQVRPNSAPSGLPSIQLGALAVARSFSPMPAFTNMRAATGVMLIPHA